MTKPRPKPKPKKKKYDYLFDSENKCWCFSSNVSNCTVKSRLLEGTRSDFHNAELQNATAEINEILDRLERGNKDSSRLLSFINVKSRLMLVWTHPLEVVTGADDEGEIARALKIRRGEL